MNAPTNPEDRLVAFLAAGDDAAPARATTDTAFVAEVMQRVARRELGVKLASTAATALAGGAVLWACAPVLNLAIGSLVSPLAPVAGVLALTVTAVLLGGQMLTRR